MAEALKTPAIPRHLPPLFARTKEKEAYSVYLATNKRTMWRALHVLAAEKIPFELAPLGDQEGYEINIPVSYFERVLNSNFRSTLQPEWDNGPAEPTKIIVLHNRRKPAHEAIEETVQQLSFL